MKNQKTILTFLVSALFTVVGAFGLTVSVKAQVTTFVPNCNGIDDMVEFTLLLDGAAGNPRTITIPYNDDLNRRCKVTTMIVPANITLDNTNGIGITLDSPNVLTVLGPVVNPVGKALFFGTGTTSFDGNIFVGANGQARLSNGAGVDTWGTPTGLVPDTRSMSTTSPLTGGGDLSTDRTIACPTCAVTSNPLAQFAATTSAELRGVLSDENGTGADLFDGATSPTFGTSMTAPIVYGGSDPGSTASLVGTSNGSPSSAYVSINPIVGATKTGTVFIGAPTTSDYGADDVLHLQGTDAQATTIYLDAYGNAPQLIGRRPTGSSDNPTATKVNNALLIMGGRGYYTSGGTGFTDASIASFRLQAAEMTTRSAWGSYATVFTTPIGGTTPAERLRVYATGDLLLGTTANPTLNSGKVLAFGENGATNPTMGANTAGLFAKNVSGTTRLFAIDESGSTTQLTGGGGGDVSGPIPGGEDGDLQMKSGTGLGPSAINDNGSVVSVSRPFELRQSGTNFARWTLDGNNSLSLAATLGAPSAPGASLVTDTTGNCTAGTHQFKVTYVTTGGETNASTPSNPVTCDASRTKVTISLPTGSTTNGLNTVALGRNIYATKADSSTYFLIAPSPVVDDNTTTAYTFDLSDSSFAATQAPAANTAVDPRIFVDSLGNVGFGTTSPQFTDDSQGRSVAIDGGTAEGYLGIGATSVTNLTGRVGALNFYNIAQGGVDHRVASIMAFNDGALGKGRLVFMTSADPIGPSGAGTINSEQNWGIGTEAVSGVKLKVQAGSAAPVDRVLSVENSAGSAAFLNVWNDGRVQLSNGKLQVDGGPFQIDPNGEVSGRSFKFTSAPKPACDSTSRGKVWYVAGDAGVKDTVEVCAKDASDAYAWRVIY